MGKKLHRKHSGFPFGSEGHPGCTWSIFHVLDFHPWHGLKEMLPHRRHGSRRHTAGVKYRRFKMNYPDTDEAQKLIDTETDDSLIEDEISEASPTSSNSAKSHMKELISEEMPKQEVHKSRFSSVSRQFLRTESIHHLEPSHPDLPDEIREGTGSPRIKVHQDNASTHASCTCNPLSEESIASPKCCEVCETMNKAKILDKGNEALPQKKSTDAKELHNDIATCQTKEFLDALEIFDVNKELVLRILKDPDYSLAHHFQGFQVAKANRGLTKSGSFPLPDLPGRKNFNPNKLKYKQKEIGFFGNREGKLLTTNKSSVDINKQSMLLMVDDNSGCAHELKNQGENRAVMNRFKDIKKRIKLAIKESSKVRHQISMDAILHKIPYGRRFSKNAKREMTNQLKESEVDKDVNESPKSSYESDVCVSKLGNRGTRRIRRTPSLTESLDRYSQLFESSFSREDEQHHCHTLKLKNEDGGLLFGHARKSTGRLLSLPNIEFYCSLQSEVSRDAVCSGSPTNEQKAVGLSISQENCSVLDASVESSSQEHLAVCASGPFDRDQTGLVLDCNGDGNATVDETIDDLDNRANGESSSISQCEQESTNNASSKLAQPSPISVLDSCFQDDITSPPKLSISEGSELKPRRIHLDEQDSLVNLQDQFVMDTLSGAGCTADLENVEIPSKHSNSDFLHFQVDRKDKADFNYVRYVLKLSGFSGNEYLGRWYLPNQPVDPSLFDEVEAYPPQPECAEDEDDSNFDHQLRFDIINEVLLEIYRRSFTYWPRPLSYNCRIHPMPIGHRVLEEVWASISWYMSSQSELEPSVDYAVVRDLSKGDEWMNHQLDSESVGFELEEMILDELLEEIIYS